MALRGGRNIVRIMGLSFSLHEAQMNTQQVIEHIRTHGPNRVVINSYGEAVAPNRAAAKGITPDVIYVRNDGWSLGAPSQYESVACATWADCWVGVIRLAPEFKFIDFGG